MPHKSAFGFWTDLRACEADKTSMKDDFERRIGELERAAVRTDLENKALEQQVSDNAALMENDRREINELNAKLDTLQGMYDSLQLSLRDVPKCTDELDAFEKHEAKRAEERAARSAAKRAAEVECEREKERADAADAERRIKALEEAHEASRLRLADVERVRDDALEENARLHAAQHMYISKAGRAYARALDLHNALMLERRGVAHARVQQLEHILGERDATIDKLKVTVQTLTNQPDDAVRLDSKAALEGMKVRKVTRTRNGVTKTRSVKEPTGRLRTCLQLWRSLGKSLFSSSGLQMVLANELALRRNGFGRKLFFQMKEPRAALQRMMNDSMNAARRDSAMAERAYMSRLLTIIGRMRWDMLRKMTKFEYDTASAKKRKYAQREIKTELLSVKHLDDMVSRYRQDNAKRNLLARFRPVWEKHLGTPAIRRLGGGGNEVAHLMQISTGAHEVAACMDMYGTAMLLLYSAVQTDTYVKHTTVVVRSDEHGPYLWWAFKGGCDEYPPSKHKPGIEGSLSLVNELNASDSTSRQWPYYSGYCKENSPTTMAVLDSKEESVGRLRASHDPNNRTVCYFKLTWNAPANLVDALIPGFGPLPPPEHESWNRPPLSVAHPVRNCFGYLPAFDLAHHAKCFNNHGTSGDFGGMGFSVTKLTLCRPEAVLMPRSEFNLNRENNEKHNYFLHDDGYWDECVRGVQAFMADYKSKHKVETEGELLAFKKAVAEHCKSQKHSFVHGVKPRSFVQLVFYCVLHLDTNQAAIELELFEAHAHEIAASRKLPYSDKTSPHRRWHEALVDSDLEPFARRLKSRLPDINQDPQDIRCNGPSVASMMNNVHRFNAALKVDDETPAEKLERDTIVTLLLMHRGISAMHSRFTLQKDEVPQLVEMGRCMLRLVDNLHLPQTYNLTYMCIGNPQLLQLNMEKFALSELLVLGLQSLGSAQGPEALHADSKVHIPMQTSGREGCHHDHLQNALLMRVAGPHVVKTKFEPKSRCKPRITEKLGEEQCRLCSGWNDEPHFLPPGYVATAIMEKGFMVRQPLCFDCANGPAVLMIVSFFSVPC